MAHNLRGDRAQKHLPKKMKILALKHLLSSKLKNNEIMIFDDLKIKEPKTKILKI